MNNEVLEIGLEEAVMKKGTKGMIKQFNDKKEASKKKKGTINANYTQMLKESYECDWKKVEISGSGAGRIITCVGRKGVSTDKIDGRKNNGAKTPYEYEINSLVLDYILKNQNELKPMSLNQWLVVTGLVDRKLTISYYNNVVKTNSLEELKEAYEGFIVDEDIAMLDHFIKTELNTLKDNLKSVFNKLERAKIIMHKVEWWGCTHVGEKQRKLTDNEFIAVGNIKREVATKYGISLKDLWKQNDETVQEYWKEYNKRLKQELGLKYVYEAHGAVVQVADKDIERYFNKLIEKDELVFCYGLNEKNIAILEKDFKWLYGKHAVKRATDRQERKNVSDHRHVEQVKALDEYVPMWKIFLEHYNLSN